MLPSLKIMKQPEKKAVSSFNNQSITTMRYLFIIFFIAVCTGTLQAQNHSRELFNRIESWYLQQQSARIINYIADEQPVEGLSADSVALYHQYINRALLHTGRYKQALKRFRTYQLPLIDNIESTGLKISVQSLHALLLKKVGKYRRAKKVYSEFYTSIPDSMYTHKVINTINFANVHWELGEYDRYYHMTHKAYLMASSHHDVIRMGITLNNIVEYYQVKRKWEKANSYLKRLVKLANQSGNTTTKARAYRTMGVNCRDGLKDLDGAIHHFIKARQLVNTYNFQLYESISYELLYTYLLKENYSGAKEVLNQLLADPRIQQVPHLHFTAKARQLQLGLLLNDQTMIAQARRFIEKTYQSINNTDALTTGLHALVLYYMRSNNIHKATTYARQLIHEAVTQDPDLLSDKGLAGRIAARYEYLRRSYMMHGSQPYIEAKQKVLQEYLDTNFKDWVFSAGMTPPGRPVVTFIILGIIIAGMAVMGLRRKFKHSYSPESEAYYKWEEELDAI